MTNERAIQMVIDLTAGNTQVDTIAKVFASEDILENGVAEWVQTPLSDHLNQFIQHNRSISDKVIRDRCDQMDFDTEYESEMKSFRDSMEGVLEAMIKYVLIHESMAEMVKSE